MVLATIDSFLSLVSTVHFTLSDDTVRVQKHAKQSSFHFSSRIRKRSFS